MIYDVAVLVIHIKPQTLIIFIQIMFLNITLVMVCYKQGIFSQQLGMYLENITIGAIFKGIYLQRRQITCHFKPD